MLVSLVLNLLEVGGAMPPSLPYHAWGSKGLVRMDEGVYETRDTNETKELQISLHTHLVATNRPWYLRYIWNCKRPCTLDDENMKPLDTTNEYI